MLNYNNREVLPLKYTEHEINGRDGRKEKVLRPMVLASIKGKNPSSPALIDSGSDKTISYLEPWGKLWDIDIEDFEGEPVDISPLGHSKLKARVGNFDVYIGEKYQINLPVYFLIEPYDDKYDNYPIILGRNVFFEKFDILFRDREKMIYLFKNE